MSLSVCKKFSFGAAHFLPDYEGPCKQIHGHTYHLEVEVSILMELFEDLDMSMLIDFKTLKQIVQEEVIDKFDHQLINSVKEFPMCENPTAENMVIWITRVLRSRIKEDFGEDIYLSRVRLYETDTCFAEVLC